MNKINEKYNGYKGEITWGYIKDGSLYKPVTTKNTITYTGADILAKLLGGDISYKPNHIGFIFGSNPEPLFPETSLRSTTWESLSSELNVASNYNIILTPLSTSPYFDVDATQHPEFNYKHNVVSVFGSTGHGSEAYSFTPTAGYKDKLEVGDYIYNVLFVNRRESDVGVTYNVFSRASLKQAGTYPQHVNGWALGVQWNITFY